MNTNGIKLKASFYTLTVLQIQEYNLQKIEVQLQNWIQQTPQFFKGLPVILDIQQLAQNTTFDLIKVNNCLYQYGFVPIGVQGGSAMQQAAAKELQLAIFPTTKEQKSASVQAKGTVPESFSTKVVKTSVRSGQQVYAKGDLVILGSVSPGAELLAEGHIHIYGKLAGRALAGISDNKEAYIFCQNLSAELVSIAGHYWLHENLQKNTLHTNAYLFLENEQLQIRTLAT